MTKGDLRNHLSGFYGEKSPSAETGRRLVALAEVDAAGQPPMPTYRAPSGWGQHLVGLAAGVALALSAVSLYVVERRGSNVPLLDPTAYMQTVNTGAKPFARTNGVPRLVAVKFQIEGCPIAAAAEPLFTELVNKYWDRPVMFTRYDITDKTRRCLSRNIALGLGVDWAYKSINQSGTIMLIDRDTREVLVTLTDRGQMPQMVRVLEDALH